MAMVSETLWFICALLIPAITLQPTEIHDHTREHHQEDKQQLTTTTLDTINSFTAGLSSALNDGVAGTDTSMGNVFNATIKDQLEAIANQEVEDAEIGPLAEKAQKVADTGKVGSLPAEAEGVSVVPTEELQRIRRIEKVLKEAKQGMREDVTDVQNSLASGAQFAIVEKRLTHLQRQNVELTAAIKAYREKRLAIKAMTRYLVALANNKSIIPLVNFLVQCNLHDPLALLRWFHDHTVDIVPGRRGDVSILEAVNYNMPALVEWLTLIAHDVNNVTVLYSAFLGLESEGNEKDPHFLEKSAEGDDIIRKITATMTRTATSLEENFYDLAAGKEIQEIIRRNNPFTADQLEQNFTLGDDKLAKHNNIERAAFQRTVIEVYKHLTNKYSFVEWATLFGVTVTSKQSKKLEMEWTFKRIEGEIRSRWSGLAVVSWCKPITLEQREYFLAVPGCKKDYLATRGYTARIYDSIVKGLNDADSEPWVVKDGTCIIVDRDSRGERVTMVYPPNATDASCTAKEY